jgi:hypothetical protein
MMPTMTTRLFERKGGRLMAGRLRQERALQLMGELLLLVLELLLLLLLLLGLGLGLGLGLPLKMILLKLQMKPTSPCPP